MKKVIYAGFIAASVILVGCNGNKDNATSSDTSTSSVDSSATVSTAAPAKAQTSNTISLSANDQMKYSATSFTVKSGEPVSLTMKNEGTLPAAYMSHDVVVLKPGTDVNTFGQEVGKVQGKIDKLPADVKSQIVAETKMLGPGESDTISFTLSAPGEYPFLCSFPGHYAAMNGKITAE